MNARETNQIGSIAESCWGDEQRPQQPAPEVPCESCQGEGLYTGEHVYLCEDCRDKLASYDLEHHDLRMSAMRAFEMFRRMDALDAPAVLIEAQARLIEQHLIGYIPTTLISRQAVENEIALWRAYHALTVELAGRGE